MIGNLIMKKEQNFKKKLFKSQLVFVLVFCMIFTVKSQHLFDEEINKSPNFFYNHLNANNVVQKEHAYANSQSMNAYDFMNLRKSVGPISLLVKITEDDYWIEEQKQIIDNLINSARTSRDIPNNTRYLDDFKGWISLTEGYSYLKESPLYEGYTFLYVAEFLYLLDRIDWVNRSPENTLWWENTLNFVETNIWNKWYVRSKPIHGNNYAYFLRSRTHMGSHWAGFAMYLGAITSNSEIQSQTSFLIEQYDILLKRNFIEVEGGYIWNSTYDDVTGTYATSASSDIIQDVSHGNHVLAYIIAAHKFGNENWGDEQIGRLAYTLKHFIYDEDSNTFADNVDGTTHESRPGRGNFIADGWVKLSSYDEELRTIFEIFGQTNNIRRYNQEFQFKSQMYKHKISE